MIMGMDGYLGWTLAMYLSRRGHVVSGVDNFSRRRNVHEVGSWSVTPIRPMEQRLKVYEGASGKKITFYRGDLIQSDFTSLVIKKEKPETIVHLGEQPSAPYSMIDVEHCNYTQMNNVVGTNNIMFAMHKYVPDCHLLKLGTMGEYGTPNVDIPEGFFEIEFRGRKDRLPFPRQPGSFYHLSKVHDSHNIVFACKIWDLRSTDIMQGVVHGIVTEDMVDDDLLTRFDFDGVAVEIMGDMHRREVGEWVLTAAMTETTVDLDGVPVCVSWLEEETLAYIRRGRLNRAAQCLPHCDQHRLLALLRREQDIGVL